MSQTMEQTDRNSTWEGDSQEKTQKSRRPPSTCNDGYTESTTRFYEEAGSQELRVLLELRWLTLTSLRANR